MCVVADDTDTLILLLYISKNCDGKLYLREGTQSSKKGVLYHDVKDLAAHLGKLCSCCFKKELL